MYLSLCFFVHITYPKSWVCTGNYLGSQTAAYQFYVLIDTVYRVRICFVVGVSWHCRMALSSSPLALSPPPWVLKFNVFFFGWSEKNHPNSRKKKLAYLSQYAMARACSTHNHHHLVFVIHPWPYFSKTCAFLETGWSVELKHTVSAPIKMSVTQQQRRISRSSRPLFGYVATQTSNC